MTRVLVVGMGGLGTPAARILVRSGVRSLTLLDDDTIDLSNLQRQVLYRDTHVNMRKAEVARDELLRESRSVGYDPSIEVVLDRLAPENALALVENHDLVLEGADNFATKFLAFDAARLAGKPIIQAGAVRWTGWAFASPARGGPCLRCVFEDMPRDTVETCSVAGIMGPVVGLVASIQAALTLRIIHGDVTATGELWSYDGLRGKLRRSRVLARPECPSCAGAISDLSRERYAPSCAA